MAKLTKKADITLLAALGWMIYFSSYITRINFGAVLVEFISAEGVLKSEASVITTVLFVTYGVGQLISGYLGDRISPRWLIFLGLTVAVVSNILLPLVSPVIPLMAVIWGVNGMAQAFMWPPLVKILTSALSSEDYARIVPGIGTSSACATIAVYLVSPLIIGIANWKAVFGVAASIAMVSAVVWLVVSGRLLKNVEFNLVSGKKQINQEPQEKTALDKALWALIPVILVGISLQGMLRDGITTWMPTFISETFNMGSSISILTGVALPVFHMLVSLCTYWILKKMKSNVFNCMAMFFSVTVVLLLGLYLFGMNSVVLSTLLIAMSIGAVHGINALQTCYLPATFSNTGNVSFLAGMLNSATYVGSALSTYLFAVISERMGWNATIVSWVIFAAAGLALTLICILHLKRKNLTASKL